MSAVVNAADLILQATIPRMVAVALDPGVVIPALKAVIVTAPSLTFQVDKAGTPSPASIVITATNRAISGAVAWSIVAGSATLTSVTTASPATATLLCANMTTPSVTIRATVVDSGVAGGLTYAADITIAKVTDGSRGARIGYGPTYSISSSSWSDLQANAVIYNELSGTSLTALSSTANNVTGDTVTLSNGTTFAQTKTWNGTAWASPGIVYDGNLLVTGTVGAGAMAAGSITAGNAAIGSAAVNTLQIAGNAVTVPVAYNAAPGQASNGSAFSYSFTVTMGQAGVLLASASLTQGYSGGVLPAWQMQLVIDGTVVSDTGTVASAWQQSCTLSGSKSVAAGTRTVTVVWICTTTTATLAAISAYAVSAMR